MTMDWTLSEDQQLLLDSLDEVLKGFPEEYIQRIDREHAEPVELNRALNDAGFGTLGFPEEYGGTPVDSVTMCLISERVAHAGFQAGFGGQLLQTKDILTFGNEEQRKRVLGLVAEGKNPFALGITEPGAGSDNSSMKTSAHWNDDGTVTFNGTKTLVTSAQTSPDLLLLAVDTDATDPRHGISMFLVPLDSPGITISPIEKMAWHTTNTSEIFLDDVTVPQSTLVGQKGNGFIQTMGNFEVERLVIAASVLGQAEAAFDDAADYAATRVQFRKPIGQFQLIQEKLTDMAIKIENMKNFVYHTASMLDNNESLKTQGAMCKRYCARAGFEVVDEALQIHGGIGVTEGVRISRLWRDMRINRIGGGTDEIMVHIVGRQIVKDHTPAGAEHVKAA